MRRALLALIVLGCTLPIVAGETDVAAAPITFAPMVKQVSPCVVTVFSSRTMHAPGLPGGMEDDPIMRRFFGGGEPRGDQKQRGLGSGVVVRKDGYILTNNHVVENADEVKVGFAKGHEQYLAKVVGTDPKTDLAVLKIDPGKVSLPVIAFGDSTKVEVGDLVFAIGNPFGVGQTVTMGIVSAIGRGVGLADYEDFLQTDASINPGNSGGALVDSNGRLIGINTAIISPTGANLGIGFAVPASLAHGIMDSIIDKGKVVRGYLGVNIQPITPELAKMLDLSSDDGAIVGDVQENSPASKAGIKPEDVIIRLNDAKVTDARHLRLMIAQMNPGTTITLVVLREGKEQKIQATLQDLPETDDRT
ncbi:MAG: trypsin-like peptidase domain-containing protein, partial [Planctomycetes bacterium]|nr:trypsin-like peptidase domain-containing protein [Planctomycetota bacterium]